MSRRRLGVLLVALVGCGGSPGAGSVGDATTTSTGETGGATTGSTTGAPTTTSASASASTSEATSAVPTTTGGTTGDSTGTTGAAEVWRSELYPDDWTPEFRGPEGRFLHDFSYAGYRLASEAPGAALPALTIDVVRDHGADASGASDATLALQAALDAAAEAGGAVVSIPAGLYRVDGQLAVTGSNTVIRGAGAESSRLWFTGFEDMSYKAHLTFAGSPQLGAEVALVSDGQARSRVVEVADVGALAVGDEVAIGWQISPEFVAEHGMDGTWMAFNDTWQVFFWRTVSAVDVQAGTLELDVPLR